MKKTNNKGFSLVELIVVIAIMAVLIGVLAPQFLKFVERGRKSTDVQNVASIITAIETYAADPMVEAADAVKDGATITITTTEAAVATGTCTDNTDKALTTAGIKNIGLKSSKWVFSSGSSLVLTVDVGTDGTVTVSSNCDTTKNDIIKGKYE